MHLSEESDDHIRELMDSSLDLELKLVSSEEKQRQIRHHYLHMLQEKDEIIKHLKVCILYTPYDFLTLNVAFSFLSLSRID